MGGLGGSLSGSKSSSSSKSYESKLAKTQNRILEDREEDYRSYYLPEFQDLYESMTPDSEAGKAQMGLTANQINQSFDSAQKQTNQVMAQQGITGSGAHLATLAANNRARSSALANAYLNQMAKSTEQKATALANFGTLMPSTTTTAPILQKSSSDSMAFSASVSNQK